jgi:hypothetical protein
MCLLGPAAQEAGSDYQTAGEPRWAHMSVAVHTDPRDLAGGRFASCSFFAAGEDTDYQALEPPPRPFCQMPYTAVEASLAGEVGIAVTVSD